MRLKEQETEYAALKKRAESVPQEIEKEVTRREAEIRKRSDAEHAQEAEFARRETELGKKTADAEAKNLREQIMRQQSEIAGLRKEAETANKKAQELAVRVVAGYAERANQGLFAGHKEPAT